MSQDLFICPDCELPVAIAPDSLCSSCAKWREGKLADVADHYEEVNRRREKMHMTPAERFAEGLADMAKATGKR